jgi:hypothetical protein
MAAPTKPADVKKSLANPEPSTHDPKRQCCPTVYMPPSSTLIQPKGRTKKGLYGRNGRVGSSSIVSNVRSEFHARIRKRKRLSRFSIDNLANRFLFENAATLSLVLRD